jgi:hypothetical protein
MVKFYKNFLIVNRKDADFEAFEYVKGLCLVFNDKSVLNFKSKNEVLIIIYPDEINKLDISIAKTPVGYIKMYFNKMHVNIPNLNFKSVLDMQKYMLIFRKFLIATIKARGITPLNYGDVKLVVFWDKHLTREFIAVLKKIGFITNLEDMMFTFEYDIVFPRLSP